MALVRYFAGARAAAGMSEETVAASTLEDLLQQLETRGDRMPAILGVSSFLIDGLATHDRSAPLPTDCVIDILPPFAGG
jgi:sulfur-carrier protein